MCNHPNSAIYFFILFSVLSLAVLHTGKRWFIVCPVAEVPVQDQDEDPRRSSTDRGNVFFKKIFNHGLRSARDELSALPFFRM